MKDFLRSKNCLILVLFTVTTSISIWLFSLPTPNLRNIMSETHKQIESQIENLKNINIDNLKNMNVMNRNEQLSEEHDLTLDETYLELLGFTNKPHLYPEHVLTDFKIPVVVTAATNKNYRKSIKLINSTRRFLGERQVVLFDLGMGSYELVYLKKHCNATFNCSIRALDFEIFPKHLKNKGMHAYLPILIQTALSEFAAIIWASSDNPDVFVTSTASQLMERANTTGILAWTIDSKDPTSAYTHPKMFEYFKASQDDYLFHRMISSDHLIVLNTRPVHENLMLPWVQCSLTLKCISPRGAQSAGCHYQRKPRYLYSGCHKYEVSALNVILGQMFNLNHDLYITDEQVFGREFEYGMSTTISSSHSSKQKDVGCTVESYFHERNFQYGVEYGLTTIFSRHDSKLK